MKLIHFLCSNLLLLLFIFILPIQPAFSATVDEEFCKTQYRVIQDALRSKDAPVAKAFLDEAEYRGCRYHPSLRQAIERSLEIDTLLGEEPTFGPYVNCMLDCLNSQDYARCVYAVPVGGKTDHCYQACKWRCGPSSLAPGKAGSGFMRD